MKHLLLCAATQNMANVYIIRDELTGQHFDEVYKRDDGKWSYGIVDGDFCELEFRTGMYIYTPFSVDFNSPTALTVNVGQSTTSVTAYPTSVENWWLAQTATSAYRIVRLVQGAYWWLDYPVIKVRIEQVEWAGRCLTSVTPGVTYNGTAVAYNPVNGWNYTEYVYEQSTDNLLDSYHVGQYFPYHIASPGETDYIVMSYCETYFGEEESFKYLYINVYYSTTDDGDDWMLLRDVFVPRTAKRVRVILASEWDN